MIIKNLKNFKFLINEIGIFFMEIIVNNETKTQKIKSHRDLICEIRDPIHGFIKLNELEKEIIDSSIFQRLQKIHHLALTYQIYPSATHKRFAHSLGVLSFATQIFEILKNKVNMRNDSDSKLINNNYLNERNWQILRLTALLHDIGHTPFSHGGEEALPLDIETNKKYKHEVYTEAIIKNTVISDIINNHEISKKFEISSEDIAAQFTADKAEQFINQIYAGQVDADKMDYLLRDSYFCGVSYGKYDAHRLINCLNIFFDEHSGGPKIGIEKGGIESVEALAIARYQMHKQVYFHKRRRILDYHIYKVINLILDDKGFPLPNDLDNYCSWNDYKVFAFGEDNPKIRENEHFQAICNRRKPFKLILEKDLGTFEKGSTRRREVNSLAERLQKELKSISELKDKYNFDYAPANLHKMQNEDYQVIFEKEDEDKNIMLTHKAIGYESQFLKDETKDEFETFITRIYCKPEVENKIKSLKSFINFDAFI